ncbi:hypothetical protein A3Q56_06720 [Intoshia linei]|uniref:Uncharacterized protein n=1 Tax=Intoshia linei TaxID=1819745 RepID=A0A177AU37_9BILA|nr:hypothetical protein A3Q56_06720 [Intoshia linei]
MTLAEYSEHVIMKSVIKKNNQCSDLCKNILMNDRLIANLSWDSILHQEMDIIDETNRNVNDLCNYKYPFIRHCKENMRLFTQTQEPIKTA